MCINPETTQSVDKEVKFLYNFLVTVVFSMDSQIGSKVEERTNSESSDEGSFWFENIIDETSEEQEDPVFDDDDCIEALGSDTSIEELENPGKPADVDDQGPFPTCSRHAVSKVFK